MTCCSQYRAAEKQFDRKLAESDLRQYQRRGATGITKLLLSELRRWPLQGAGILDVGSGIGVISMELAGDGVSSATVVEASSAYLEVARREVASRYGSRRTQFILGDFAVIAPDLADADVVTLDRVVCCYPDAEALLRGVAARARRLVAFTYPHDRWYMRALTAFNNLKRRLKGNTFQTFVHPPRTMAAVLEAAGFVRIARKGTVMWLLDIYRKEGASAPI